MHARGPRCRVSKEEHVDRCDQRAWWWCREVSSHRSVSEIIKHLAQQVRNLGFTLKVMGRFWRI